MSLRHILLGLLSGTPMSGYELTKTFESSLAFVWSAQHSQIYPELKRLLANGLIEQVGEGPRGRKSYAITRKGSEELHRWLVEVEPDRAIRDQSAARIFFLWQLKPAQAVTLLEKEKAVQIQDLERFEEILHDIKNKESDPPWGVLPVRLGIMATEARLEWIEQALREFRKKDRKKPR